MTTCLEKRGVVDLNQFGSGSDEVGTDPTPRVLLATLAPSGDNLRHAQADSGERDRSNPGGRNRERARPGVLIIEAGDHLSHDGCVGNRVRHHRNAIERPARRHDTASADKAHTRLETDDPVQRRGNAPGPRGIGRQRKRNQARRNSYRGS